MKRQVKQFYQYKHNDQATLAASNNSLLIKYNTNTYDVDNSGLAMHRHKHVKGLNSQVIT
jgi:hypothetical protein